MDIDKHTNSVLILNSYVRNHLSDKVNLGVSINIFNKIRQVEYGKRLDGGTKLY